MENQERKLNLKSKDIISHNVELINQLFPHCITEQNGKKVVDFEKLKQEFSDDIVDEIKEKYELTWPGKREAIREARTSTTKTLLPDMNKSVDFENTNNVYIEGDNLEVLKILQESYLNKIKCIYIDPPYNTGKDFIYNDNFSKVTEEELFESGQIDGEGNKFTQNLESNGRYHSDWLSMMYPRLKLARNLLKEDGVIFISIDDNEYDNLKKICDEIFGEHNFVTQFIWEKTYSPKNNNKYVSGNHESILCYAKNLNIINKFNRLSRNEETNKMYKLDDNDGKGLYRLSDLTIGGQKGYNIVWEGKTFKEAPTRGWAFSESKMYELIKEGRIYIPDDENKRPAYKRYLSEVDGIISKTILTYKEVNHTDGSKKYLNKLVGNNVFDYPKPFELIERFLTLVTSNDDCDIVLDFFSGSSTTAEAVLKKNSFENGNRKYIMVQIDEEINGKSNKAAYDFCIENSLEPIIPSIAQERIKRAGAKIKEETGADIDYGFRVYKLSDSILNSNKILPKDMAQTSLDFQASKYVEGTRKEDIVISIILDLGLMLDSDIKLLDNDCYVIEENLLFICLSDSFDMVTLDKIKEIGPDQVVLSEDSFEEDDVLTNTIQEIKNINSDIEVKLI